MTCLYKLNTDRRDIGRKEYKLLYRYLRVASRKAEKLINECSQDLLLYGSTAVVITTYDGRCRHVPLKDIYK